MWHDGKTENISRSGVLIRAEDYLPEQAEVECRLTLAVESLRGQTAELSCRGHVVRTISSSDNQTSPAVAVAIEEYDFLRERVEQESNEDGPSASGD